MTTETTTAPIARAAVLTGRRRIEIREFPIPAVGPRDGVLAIEVNGVCGSDAEFYDAALDGYPMPMTLGHEPVGRVVALGEELRRASGVDVGDRVVVNSAIRCGRCADCAAGGDCRSRSYGTVSPDEPPGLWGGMATHLYLAPGATLIPLAEHVTPAAAAFHNPLANGFQWTVESGRVGPGTTVAVLGAGPRGLACALVAVHSGAEHVTWVGLPRDRERLALAAGFGIHDTYETGSDDPDELRDALGRPVDVVVDTTPYSTSAVEQGLHALKRDGRLVLAGLKGSGRRLELEIDLIARRRLTVTGPHSKGLRSLRLAVRALNDGGWNLDAVPSRAYPLDHAAAAIESLASADPARPLQVRVQN
ncbi:zinc-dependent alcohol dehydrogenase [Actinomadura formosensis]|uniref:zinc-dependent alcohol dehydrogenase n=1 Tax=Actinomadura formosensis TaxID=60706 RepID=UPI00082F0F02|nr:alcohol dehydrogenase catalytic domain-containing protein [Actinomadura formosensis]